MQRNPRFGFATFTSPESGPFVSFPTVPRSDHIDRALAPSFTTQTLAGKRANECRWVVNVADETNKKPRRTPQGCCDGAGTEKRPMFTERGDEEN